MGDIVVARNDWADLVVEAGAASSEVWPCPLKGQAQRDSRPLELLTLRAC